MSIQPPFGSNEWKEWVFSTPPARALKGRSKPTQYHQIWSKAVARLVGAQGRNEAIALLALEYLHNLGKVRRLKEQPFKTSLDAFTSEIVPDYLAELAPNGSLIAIEVKTERFLTRIKEAELKLYASEFSQHKIKYKVWTDKHPLSRHVRVNLMAMRRASSIVSGKQQRSFTEFIHRTSTCPVSRILSAGYDLDCIFAAAWQGAIFFDLAKEVRPESLVRTTSSESNVALFLGGESSKNSWWNALRSLTGA